MYIENQTFDEERALYGIKNATVRNCLFDGPKDGESAFKECENITVEQTIFKLRYPFWHDHGLKIKECELTENCRAALWYGDHIEIEKTKMHGIKALRECNDIVIKDCQINSSEFGWMSRNIQVKDAKAISEYFMMRAENVRFENVEFTGKYSFQYLKDAYFENCVLDTKDAFWHSENVWVRNSVVKGEYLAWYSHGLVLENCKIIGTQPLCYCEDLKLINCEMTDTDLAFEKSTVKATIKNSVLSIKNPKEGEIIVPAVKEIIMDDPFAKANIIQNR